MKRRAHETKTSLGAHPLRRDPGPDASLARRDGWMNLAAAVVAQAAVEARKGREDAACWLLDDGLIYAEVIGFDTNIIKSQVTQWLAGN